MNLDLDVRYVSTQILFLNEEDHTQEVYHDSSQFALYLTLFTLLKDL